MQATRYGLVLGSLLALAALMQGCAPSITKPEPAEPGAAGEAGRLAEAGRHGSAAQLYLELAGRLEPAQAARYRLAAAENLLLAGRGESAAAALEALDPDLLGAGGRQRLSTARAALRLEAGEAGQAMAELGPPPGPDAPAAAQRLYYRTLGDAARLSDMPWESARARAELDAWVSDPQQRLDNQLAILQSLSALPGPRMETLRERADARMRGWLDLALLVRAHAEDPEEMRFRLANWRQRYPGHPADPDLAATYVERYFGSYGRAEQIAVLLPETGPYASAADALRNGVLAAYYQQAPERRPVLRFYDTTDTRAAWPRLQAAADDGAELVLGPLQKDALAQLARAGELPLPVLAFNQIELETRPPENLFQFGLIPEAEARAAAERAWADGYREGLVFWPQGSWGERLREAFRTRFEELGGLVVESRSYDPSQNDFSDPIQSLLNLDASRARHRELQRLFGRGLEFEPRRRQDAGFVFVAADITNARKIRPQLQFHHASDLPVYATSHIYSGSPLPRADVDLEGVLFPDMPWILAKDDPQAPGPESPGGGLPDSTQRYPRLYALGFDSYRLLPHLARLQFSPSETFDGATGRLSLDALNRVQRRPLWARFEQGSPRVLGYAATAATYGSRVGPADRPRERPSGLRQAPQRP